MTQMISFFIFEQSWKEGCGLDASLARSVQGFGPYCTWGHTKELQLFSSFGIDGCRPDSSEPVESGAVVLREPGFGIRYMNTDLFASLFLKFVRLSRDSLVTCDDKSLWGKASFYISTCIMREQGLVSLESRRHRGDLLSMLCQWYLYLHMLLSIILF